MPQAVIAEIGSRSRIVGTEALRAIADVIAAGIRPNVDLGRKAGQSEVAFWVGQYHQGKTNEDIVTGFLASDEYFKEHTS